MTVVAFAAGACGNALDVQNEQDIVDINLDSPDAIAMSCWRGWLGVR